MKKVILFLIYMILSGSVLARDSDLTWTQDDYWKSINYDQLTSYDSDSKIKPDGEILVEYPEAGYKGSITQFLMENVEPEFYEKLTSYFNRKDTLLLPRPLGNNNNIVSHVEHRKNKQNTYGCIFDALPYKRTNTIGERELDFVIVSSIYKGDIVYADQKAEALEAAAQKYSTIKDKKVVSDGPFWGGDCDDGVPRGEKSLTAYFFTVERISTGPAVAEKETNPSDASADSNKAKKSKSKSKATSESEPALVLKSTDHSEEDAKRAKEIADAKKLSDEENKKAQAVAEKRKGEEAAAKAAKEDKQKQWCLADKTRMNYCSCSKYNPVKGGVCMQ